MRTPYLEGIRKQTREQTRAEGILEFLQERFPGQVSSELKTLLEQSCDDADLRAWIRKSASASSVEEFRRQCGI